MRVISDPDDLIEQQQKKVWGHSDVPSLVVIFLAIYIFLSYIIPTFLFLPRIVEGSSMQPTLKNGDVVLLYQQGEIDYGDIIVCYAKGIQGGEDIIKRVIGKPGDTVGFVNSQSGYSVYREHIKNGMKVRTVLEDEYYITPAQKEMPLIETTLGKDEYFVMGDNRDDSTDSRDSRVGKVNISNIKGKVLFIIRDQELLIVKRPVY